MIKTVSLETAKKLKEKGFRQDTFSYLTIYNKALSKESHIRQIKHPESYCKAFDVTQYAAPTTDELLEELPSRLDETSGVLIIFKETECYEVCYGCAENKFYNLELLEALASMWLWLKKEGLIK